MLPSSRHQQQQQPQRFKRDFDPRAKLSWRCAQTDYNVGRPSPELLQDTGRLKAYNSRRGDVQLHAPEANSSVQNFKCTNASVLCKMCIET